MENESDWEVALRLHHQLNGMNSELSEVGALARPANIAGPSTRGSIVSISDSSPEVGTSVTRSRSPIKKDVSQVTFDNQQAITVIHFLVSNPESDHSCRFFLSDQTRENVVE